MSNAHRSESPTFLRYLVRARSKRHRRRIRALLYRSRDGVLPRRVLQDRTRRPWKPHHLRGGHCRVSRASILHRQRSEYSDATIRFSRSCGGRSVVRYRSKLAPFSSRWSSGICGLSLDARACPRNSSAGSPPRARRRRSSWTRGSQRLVSADAEALLRSDRSSTDAYPLLMLLFR